MKTTTIFLACIMMSAMTFGQNNPQFQTADGQQASSIYNYVREHINYPGGNSGCFVPGTEVIAFTVTSTGELTDFRVVNSVSRDMDEEMIRVLKETSGSWHPGQINGETVAMEHEVALTFIPYHFDPVREATKYLAKGNRLVSKNQERALKFYNEAFRLLPCNESILIARSQCKFKLGDVKGAIQDCNRVLAINSSSEIPEQLLGYEK